MTLALFDRETGGFHARYLRRFAEVLSPHREVLIAAPEETLLELSDVPARLFPIDDRRASRQPTAMMAKLGLDIRRCARLADAELTLIDRVVAEPRVDEIVHLYGDPLIYHISRRRRVRVPMSLYIHFSVAHYPSAFGTELTRFERVQVAYLERSIAAWRRHSDARYLLTPDEDAAQWWNRRGGARARWIPDPMSEYRPPEEAQTRSGCVVYGALARWKGIDLLAQAVTIAAPPVHVVIAGAVEPGYQAELDQHIAMMRRSGARVEVLRGRRSQAAALGTLAGARCAVLSYLHHQAISGVLIEAALTRTPIVAHDYGWIGNVVRRHQLGEAVDCTNPSALRDAILRFTEDPDAVASYEAPLARFAARYGTDRFEAAVAPFAPAALATRRRP